MFDDERFIDIEPDDISNLSCEEGEKHSRFKAYLLGYSDSVQQLQSAEDDALRKFKQRNTMLKSANKQIPIRVYFEKLGLFLLFGFISSYYILTSNELQITQSYIKMFLFLLHILLIIMAVFIPLFVFPNKL
ncbi:hypothetical protein [Methanolobus sp.]|uniref:hypothetical protein n=1 Tax=Methanolobus sp. TaxID=1874737 RepID=UPI0025D4CDFC|nr:hypothetical protein [Methanolobus sp.]